MILIPRRIHDGRVSEWKPPKLVFCALLTIIARLIKLAVCCGVTIVLRMGQPVLAADTWPPNQIAGAPTPDDWKERRGGEAVAVLKQLSAQMQGNYERIHTWKGVYHEKSQNFLSGELLRGSGVANVAGDGVTARFSANHRFAIDVTQNLLFSTIEQGIDAYEASDPAASKKPPLSRTSEVRMVLTSEHYLHYKPLTKYGRFGALRHIEQPTRRAAFRSEAKDGIPTLFSNDIDPRQFFGPSEHHSVWEQYAHIIERHTAGGAAGPRIDENVFVFSATMPNGTWSRVDFVEGATKKPATEYVHYSGAGFNVVHIAQWDPPKSKDEIPRLWYSWKYDVFDGIFVPVTVNIRYQHLATQRVLALSDCVLNEPIESSQFSFTALGVQEGDLIMDDIEHIAYTFQSGSLTKLTDYAEPVQPPSGADVSSHEIGSRRPALIPIPDVSVDGRRRLTLAILAVNFIVIVVALGCFLYVRWRRARRR